MGIEKNKKVCLAYSGGLDTSVIVRWLADQGYDVIAVTVDLGQNENLNLKQKALQSGAKKFVLKDMKQEFVEDGVFQLIKAEAKYENRYLLGTSIARPYIMKALVEVALKEKTNLIAHGATGKGNDQCRFELVAYSLMPNVEIIAPWRIKEFRELIPGRMEAIAFAEKNGIPIKATTAKPWSIDANMAHSSFEAGILEDPNQKPPKAIYEVTCSPDKAPNTFTKLAIGFENGVPVNVNGKKMSPVKLLNYLNTVGAKNGIGYIDIVENRFVGMKSRGVYQAPGVTILYQAHRDLEGLCMDRDLMHLRDQFIPQYAKTVYNGFWCSRQMQALNTFVDETQKGITGIVSLELYKGNVIITGRTSEYSLYSEKIATMEGGGTFNQDDSTGFLKIQGLPLKVQAGINKKLGIHYFSKKRGSE
ncbi:MAG: argininosuccinate synthase [Candidatus Diapherotrites archaeon]|nr:argininosuccinate synthase [Candidatus Diapherotrites archaeon]